MQIYIFWLNRYSRTGWHLRRHWCQIKALCCQPVSSIKKDFWVYKRSAPLWFSWNSTGNQWNFTTTMKKIKLSLWSLWISMYVWQHAQVWGNHCTTYCLTQPLNLRAFFFLLCEMLWCMSSKTSFRIFVNCFSCKKGHTKYTVISWNRSCAQICSWDPHRGAACVPCLCSH